MSNLSQAATELIQAGRAALQPSAADHQRVLTALMMKIDGGAPPATSGSSSSGLTGIGKISLVKVVGAIVGIGIGSGGLYLALNSNDSHSAATHLGAPTVSAHEPKVANLQTPIESSQVRNPLENAALGVYPSAQTIEPSTNDSLAHEVAILSRASAELHEGQPQKALDQLAEHQRKYPEGLLVQERLAARVQALCALGRTVEARAELMQLAKLSPDSLYESQARKACGFEVVEKD